jgi:D-serine deaminase-like pyridoxal phosphate-dependent protein
MTVLGWVAVLVGAWCAVSVVAALGLGALLRRGSVVDGDLSHQGRGRCRLADGALAMWLAEVPHVPDSPEVLMDDIPAQRPRDVDSGFSEVPTFR